MAQAALQQDGPPSTTLMTAARIDDDAAAAATTTTATVANGHSGFEWNVGGGGNDDYNPWKRPGWPRPGVSPPAPTTNAGIQDLGSTGKGILIGMLSAFGTAALVGLVVAIFFFFRYTSHGRILLDRFSRPGEFDDEQQFLREEEEALAEMDELRRAEYLRAKAFVQANPPESVQTDISLSQFLAIQEKGVSAWEFEPELEIANCFVEARTEIEFFDSECSVQSNLPIPKQNEVYYWEAKLYDKPETTTVSIGLTTKPYPLFRLPGLHKYSVAYLSTGQRRYNQPFTATNYGPPYVQGDIIGVGYRPRTGAIFFTRNGKKFEEVAHGLKTQNFFPTVGANGPCNVHVNFGQMGFVFLEAQVKKWGLAPMTGSLAPPPPYGSEAGSILLEGGREGVREGQGGWYPGHGRTSSNQLRLGGRPMRSPNGPERSPTDISLAQLNLLDYTEATSGAGSGMGSGDDHHNLVSPTTTADDDAGEGSAAAFSPPPRNSSYKPQQHHRQYSSSQQHHYQSLPPPQMHLDPGLPLEPADHPPPEYESPEDEERREFLMSGGRGYEHRGSSRSGSSSGSGSGEEDDSPTPRAGQPQQQQSRNPNLGRRRRDQSAQYQQQRQHHQQGRQRQHRPDSPPIPSYEAAVDDARRQGLS